MDVYDEVRGLIVLGTYPAGQPVTELELCERLGVKLAAHRQRDGELSPASLARLVKHADLADQATRQGDLVAGVRHNRAFHQYVATLADNPAASEVLDRIWDQITVSTRASLTAPARPGLVDDEHRRLIAAIADGDPPEAAARARAHVLATMSVLTEQGEVT
jgi:DNA-binding GntR family transcriptional regulator